MKSTINSIIVTILFVVPIVGSFSVYAQETTNNVRDQIQTTAEQIKNMANEVANNSTGTINQTEAEKYSNAIRRSSKENSISRR